MSGIIEYSLAQLAGLLEVDRDGDPDICLSGMATLGNAGPGQLSFYNNPRYHQDLKTTRAGAVILAPEHAHEAPCAVLLSAQPYVTYAHATRLYVPEKSSAGGIHPSAVIDPGSRIGQGVTIGPCSIVEANVEIADNVCIGAHCQLGQGVSIGSGSRLEASVTLYPRITLGRSVVIHANTVIGSDGFGYAYDGGRHVKIEQLGSVLIGDQVEIGAGCTIDCGALDDTVIGSGVKIDNQVQIAHNVTIGDNTIICGCSAVAGSAKIGANCIIAGAVGIANHVTIVDGVTVTAMTLVNRDIRSKGVYSSGTGLTETSLWKRNMLRFGELDAMARQLKKISKERR